MDLTNGDYSIESVTLSSELENDEPVDLKDTFMPSEVIICTVKTVGKDDGIIGMRWFLGDNKIYEYRGKTKDNLISTYIYSQGSAVLPEGKYRVEIFILEETLETVYFDVKVYHPTVNPQISTPEGHQAIEAPWFPEIPFAFDEIWNIDDVKWNINEVKVVLADDSQDYFVAIVVNTDMIDLLAISEDEAKTRIHPVALYAINNGYLEKARNLEIDGKYYDLDQMIIVVLVNPSNQQLRRVEFSMDELK